jgi:F0F1-type ATP synthase membrane subunit c/vacuolar-type H+-ATPase subunit K
VRLEVAVEILKILKYAFVVATLLYAVVAVMVAGPPDWSRPLLPERQDGPLLCGIFLTLALVDWVAGYVVGNRSAAPAMFSQAAGLRSWPQTRLVIAAALIESGAIFGLVLALLFKDSRPALLASGVSAVLLLMTPASGADQGPA